MATITPVAKPALALNLALVAAATGGDQFANAKGRTIIVVRNGHATLPRTATLNSYQAAKVQGYGQIDEAVVIPAGRVSLIGPLDKKAWNNPSNRVEVAYSDSAADLTVAAYEA